MVTSIKSKILLLVVALMTVTMFAVIFITEKNFEIELKDLHHKLAQDALQSVMYILENEYDTFVSHELDSIARRRELMENMSASVLAMIHGNYQLLQAGLLSEDEAQRNSLRWINNFRYGANQYFFVCDMDLTGLSHPLQDMIGKTWTGFEDVKLKDALLLMRKTVQEENNGYTVFQWPALADQTLVKQMGYFRYYPEWEWMIGTAVRIDDLEKDSHKKLEGIVKKLESIFLNLKLPETGHIFLFTGEGDMLIHPEMSGENISDDPLKQRLMTAAEDPEKPIEYSRAFLEEGRQIYFAYVNYLKALDWYVAASISNDAIIVPARRLAIRQAYIILSVLFCGIVIAVVLSKKIAHPLETLSQYARGLPEKDLAVEEAQPAITFTTTSTEITQLSESFIFMESQLRKNLKELDMHRKHLEELVETRTGELVQANKQLQQEITERKQTEEALRESEKRYRQLVELSPDSIVVHSEGKFVFMNPAALELFGARSAEDLIGKPVLDSVHPGYREIVQDRIRRSLQMREKTPLIEEKFFRVDGTIIDVEVTGMPFTYEGKPAILVVQRDITDRKRAEEALKESEQQLRELNASKDKFFSIIAHDLKGPLNSLQQLIQFTEEHLENYSPDKLKEIIVLQRTSTENLFKLLENLLTWSRIQRGMLEYHPQQIELERVAAQNIALLTPNARQKQITLSSSIPENVFVYADHNMVDTVVRNLISNALKFTHAGGIVDISARQDENVIEVSVSDTGIGIAQEHLPKLFRIETKYKRLGTAREKGTGLGLILCKELVEKNGGRIWGESEVGKGTTFRFTLPRMPTE